MKKNTISALTLSLLALGLASSQSQATQGSSQYVESVSMSFQGMAAVIKIENSSANKHLNALDLEVSTNTLKFDLSGTVVCQGSYVRGTYPGFYSFGPVGMNGDLVNYDATLYTKPHPVAFHDSYSPKFVEAEPVTFNVPLNEIKNGHPAVRVDPLEELNKKLQAHLQGGGTALDFYRNDQDIVLQRPISLSAVCTKALDPNKASAGFETKNHTIQINYKGDPALNETPVLNAQLQGNMANQIDAGDQPFKLNSAEFMANIPHHFGQCIPDQNPVIRVNYNITGDEMGEMDFRIVAYSNQYADYGNYYQNLGVAKNPENAGMNQHFDFEFPLNELLSQDKYSWMAISDNKTYNHNMLLQARSKPALGQMSQWKDMDTAIFKHRCVPQLNGQLGNQGGIQGYDNGKPAPTLNGTIKAKPLAPKIDGVRAPLTIPTPTPKPMGKAMPAPAPTPKPLGKAVPAPTPTPKPMTLRAPAQVPTPKPLTIKPIEPEPVNELQLKTR